ncbi:MAG TPA: fumarylacetoacetate hydrolase family protein [Candidatus Limnocylindrales bacterium]|jgi:2-keto-4-pentenoate hydratase/2-oxohepta-3-ene-1,7-dioic acid hydratase in catechol pathway
MRFASVMEDGAWSHVVVREDRYLPLATGMASLDTVIGIADSGADGLTKVAAWVEAQSESAWRALDATEAIGPPVDPGAIYTIGENYRSSDDRSDDAPVRPLVFGKAAASVSGQGGVLAWDRTLTAKVDPECELGVVIGPGAWRVDAADAMRHVFGYTVINDVSSRDPWLDGDQWLLGKSMNGFCPVGPWIVTADELEPEALRLGCMINGVAIQDGTTADMRFGVPEIVAYLSRHLTLSPGDLIATGTPARLSGPLGPDRHLEIGDTVTVWIERIGELTTTIA